MSGPPASNIVEQAHLQCSVYYIYILYTITYTVFCICPMLDMTQTNCLSTVSMELSTPCVQGLRISCLLCNANALVSVCGTPDTQLATEEL